jgi:FkbM family methyltransferase
MPYYSQSGEDYILSKLFEGQNEGFFVEIGCIDGKRFSNTLHFAERGWKGLCVEAHNDYIELLKENRPESIIVHAAVGECDEKNVKFYANSRGSLSSLDESKGEEFQEKFGEYFTGFEVQQVEKLTLNSIFTKHNITKIDILSLDIEGYEVEALQGLDLKKFRPTVFVIESDSLEQQQQFDALLFPAGYTLIGKIGANLFYSSDMSLHGIIDNKDFGKVSITHTKHPLDKGTDKIQTVRLSTIPENTSKKMKLINRILKKLMHLNLC